MKRTATIVLNRNLPDVTNKLCDYIDAHNNHLTDIFVVESGSDHESLSRYCTWHANWPEAIKEGLRYPRGFNYGLYKLFEENKMDKYDFFFLVCNDVSFLNTNIIEILENEIDKHPRVGILSPCSEQWGEKNLISNSKEMKYFWHTQFLAWFIRREFIEDLIPLENQNFLNFFFDGNNYRGYGADLEIIAKAYANDWACAITPQAWQIEDESFLKTKAAIMHTDSYDINIQKLIQEGKNWLRNKYGFNSRWLLQMYSKNFYDKFFEHYPELNKFKIN
jgi:hypothetical protein